MTQSRPASESKVGKAERLLNLLALFLGSRAPVPFSGIAGRVAGYDDGAASDALEKRFDRDRGDLRELGVAVEYGQPLAEMPPGYFVRKDAVFQRKVTITTEEAVLLSAAARVGAAATGGGRLLDALQSALRKLAVDAPPVDAPAGPGSVPVLRVDAGDLRASASIAGIAEAIARKQRLRFRYRGMRDERARARVVSPWGLGLFRGSWYLAGFDHERRGIRVFKAARIQGSVVADAGGARPEDVPPPGFRIEEHLPREAHDVGRAAPRAVFLRVARHLDPAAFAPSLDPKVQSTDARGSFVSIKARRPEALVPWILSSGGDVAVVKPASLRASVARAADALLRAARQGGAS
jgi:proteasome accessory factor B